ncbi:hypothetical protein EV142_10754 [Flavobacterium circumlabens]|uniref:Uncharacterized protein n=1 Tax=Flavobacterium circumlabens TaxID=2133765 RepID=A0ABY2AVV4_9FLAO|nr:hypothetical protein EV142_10754 [Flavobacterium circumlabens]
MKRFKIFFILLNLFLLGCSNSEKKKVNIQKTNTMTQKTLVNHVELAINPKFKDWV